jgi:hypothetical protein
VIPVTFYNQAGKHSGPFNLTDVPRVGDQVILGTAVFTVSIVRYSVQPLESVAVLVAPLVTNPAIEQLFANK